MCYVQWWLTGKRATNIRLRTVLGNKSTLLRKVSPRHGHYSGAIISSKNYLAWFRCIENNVLVNCRLGHQKLEFSVYFFIRRWQLLLIVLSPNSINSICCGFVVQQIHSNLLYNFRCTGNAVWVLTLFVGRHEGHPTCKNSCSNKSPTNCEQKKVGKVLPTCQRLVTDSGRIVRCCRSWFSELATLKK